MGFPACQRLKQFVRGIGIKGRHFLQWMGWLLLLAKVERDGIIPIVPPVPDTDLHDC